MKRVLVTGVAGMVGSNLARVLLEQGCKVFGVDDLSRGRREFVPSGVHFMYADVSDRYFSIIYSSVVFDAVYHTAARVGGVARVMEEEWRNQNNAAIDWKVLEYCMASKSPLVYVSTCCVYPPWLTSQALKEEDSVVGPPDARLGNAPDEGLYGMAKLAGEMAVKAAVQEGLDAKIVRMFNVYGPHEIPDVNAHIIPALIGKVLRKELPMEVWGDGTQKRSFLYVDDAARGIIAAMERGRPGEVYNLGTEKSYTVNEIAEQVLIRCGYDKSALRNDPSKPRGVEARYADISKAKRDLGWQPTTGLPIGIHQTVSWCEEWMRNNG